MITLYTKRSIIPDVKKLINPFKEDWVNIEETNCYAYALGLDAGNIDLHSLFNYNPGTFIEEELYLPFSIKELLSNLEGDFETLGIEYIEVNPDFIINKDGLKKEWKISVMATREYSLKYYDFHFLRQTINGIWTHKKGFREEPTNLDSEHKKIINPIDSIIETGGLFLNTRYEYIKTYCLRR